MHKLYNQATCQEVAPKPETRQRQRRMRGERDTEGELSQVLNVAMANDALKPKTKQLPKSFRKEQGKEQWGGRKDGGQSGRLAGCLAGLLTCRLAE